MRYPIRPLMLDAEGISKKLSVPFLEPLQKNQPFSILIKTTLPRAVTKGFGYYTATLSFAQDRVRQCTVQLDFAGTPPQSVRVYEIRPGKPVVLIKTLPPTRIDDALSAYVDVVEEAAGQSSRIYVFRRE